MHGAPTSHQRDCSHFLQQKIATLVTEHVSEARKMFTISITHSPLSHSKINFEAYMQLCADKLLRQFHVDMHLSDHLRVL